MKKILYFFAWMLLWIFLSCDFIQEDLQKARKYIVQVPELPAAWQEQNSLVLENWDWKIRYFSSSYRDNSLQQREEYRSGNAVTLTLKKQESAVILLYPKFLGIEALWQPAGLLLMWREHSEGGGNLRARWQEGFLSLVFYQLGQRDFDVRYLNIDKLRYYLQKRMQQNPEDFLLNPWDYDREFLLQELSRLQMDWYDIRLRPEVRSFGLPAGRWQPLNVLEPAILCRTPCSPKLSVGLHNYLELEEMQVWQIQVEKNGRVLSLPL